MTVSKATNGERSSGSSGSRSGGSGSSGSGSNSRKGTPAELASGCVFTTSPNYPGVPIVYRTATQRSGKREERGREERRERERREKRER